MIWGSSFILMKRTLEFYSNFELGALRIIFAAMVLLPFAIRRMSKLNKDQWFWLIVVGLIGNTIPAFLFATAQTGIDSSLAGILNSTTPMFTLIVGVILFKLQAKRINFIGIIIGFIGAIMIILTKDDGPLEFNLQYSAYVILASVFYAFNLNFVKYKLAETDAVTIAAVSYSIMLIPISLFLVFGTDFVTTVKEPGAFAALIYPAILGIVCSAIAIVIFNYLVKIAGVLFSASVTYMIPIIASIIGVIDGETFKAASIIWIAVILFGVYLVNKKSVKG